MPINTAQIVINNGNVQAVVRPTIPVVIINAGSVSSGGGTSALTQNHIFVGNVTNVATDVAMSQDASIVASGAVTVNGLKANVLPALSAGVLQWSGSAWVFNNTYPSGAFTSGSVIFMGASALSQDNANFFWNAGSHILSVNTNGDFTGTDSINVYNEVDAYNPNSAQGTIGASTVSGFTASSSRGTGASPVILNTLDVVGSFSGWGYTGSSPAYTAMAGMWITSVGVTANNLGGQLEFWTKIDNGSLTRRSIIDNAGDTYIFSGGKIQINETASPIAFATTESLFIHASQNAYTGAVIQNGISGSASEASIQFRVSAIMLVGVLSNTFTTSGINVAGSGRITVNNVLNIGTSSSNQLAFWSNNVEQGRFSNIGNFLVGTASDQAKFYLFQAALSSTWIPTFKLTPGSHTAITNTLENLGVDFNFATPTWTWAGGGTVATQRSFYVRGITLAASSAQTFTNAYSLYVDPPVAGTNALITNSYAAGFGGKVQFTPSATLAAINIGTFGGDPSTTVIADLWYNSSAGVLRSRNTTGVVNIVNGTIGSNQIAIGNGQSNNSQLIGNSNFTYNGITLAVSQSSQSTTNTLINITQAGHTGGVPVGFSYTGGVLTGVTATNELIDVQWLLNRTVTFATGAIVQNRSFVIQNPTYAFVASSTITDAMTVAIGGGPTQGANTTITNSHALWIQGQGSGTNTYGLTVNASSSGTNNFAAQFKGGKVLFTTSTTTAAFNTGGFTADPSVPFEGDVAYNTTTHLLKFYNGTSWVSASGGITNSAANNEIPKSNGTNIIGTKIFSTSNGSFVLGDGIITTPSISGATFTDASLTTLTLVGSTSSGAGNNGGGVNIIGGTAGAGALQGTVVLQGRTVNINVNNGGGGNGSIFTTDGAGNLLFVLGVTNTNNIIYNCGSSSTGNMSLGLFANSVNINSGNISIFTSSVSGTGTEGSINIQTRATGKLGFFNVAGVIQQSVNTILVNNVTSGGTVSTIADFTSLTVYATDAPTIRNDIFRLAEKVLKLETALRNYGLAIN